MNERLKIIIKKNSSQNKLKEEEMSRDLNSQNVGGENILSLHNREVVRRIDPTCHAKRVNIFNAEI